MRMRGLISCALLLLSAAQAFANAEDLLLSQIYSNGGTTLYCGKEFQAGGRVKVDYIYNEKLILRKFNCITARQCRRKPEFIATAGDLHNLYPIERKVELDRRGSRFGPVPSDVSIRECGYRLSFQTFNPPDAAKGNIARAMVYMHKQHGLPLLGSLDMYQRWNKLDPPDAAEKARNEAISKVQKKRNPYIDNPALIERMSGF